MSILEELKHPDMWTRTKTLIRQVLTEQEAATLEDFLAYAKDAELVAQDTTLRAFCALYDVPLVFRKAFVGTGLGAVRKGVYIPLSPVETSPTMSIDETPTRSENEESPPEPETQDPPESEPSEVSEETEAEKQESNEAEWLSKLSKKQLVKIAKREDIDHRGNRDTLLTRLLEASSAAGGTLFAETE